MAKCKGCQRTGVIFKGKNQCNKYDMTSGPILDPLMILNELLAYITHVYNNSTIENLKSTVNHLNVEGSTCHIS